MSDAPPDSLERVNTLKDFGLPESSDGSVEVRVDEPRGGRGGADLEAARARQQRHPGARTLRARMRGVAYSPTPIGRVPPCLFLAALFLVGPPPLCGGVRVPPKTPAEPCPARTPIHHSRYEPSAQQSLDFFSEKYQPIYDRDLPLLVDAGVNTLQVYVMDET